MRGMDRRPELKTTALGGVATGSINAQLAARVIGMTNRSGSFPVSTARAAITGRKVAVVARLLVSSVRKMTRAVAATINKMI